MPLVEDWLKKMGYRLLLRKLTYPARVRPHGVLPFTSWWENKGVAPCYRDFSLALRLVGEGRTEVLVTDADITSWLPGDSLFDDRVFLPPDLPEGEYELHLGIVDPQTRKPRVRLAIEGRSDEGWYPMGTITVEDGPFQVGVERDLDTPDYRSSPRGPSAPPSSARSTAASACTAAVSNNSTLASGAERRRPILVHPRMTPSAPRLTRDDTIFR